MQKMFY